MLPLLIGLGAIELAIGLVVILFIAAIIFAVVFIAVKAANHSRQPRA